jgi:IS30 family transposase
MDEVKTKIAELQDKGWSISALADELGVQPWTVTRWIKGERNPENPKTVLLALDAIGRKRNIPKRKRYPGTHHLQRNKTKQES